MLPQDFSIPFVYNVYIYLYMYEIIRDKYIYIYIYIHKISQVPDDLKS